MSGQFDPQMMQQIMQMMQTQRQDPFSRPMPGQGLLGDGNMASPQMPQGPQAPGPEMMGQMPGMDMGGMQGNPGMMQAPTEFADTQPGLPNLPSSFGGFGFGQFAPEEVQPMGLRQQYIQQLMKTMPQMAGALGQSLSPIQGGAMGQIPRMPPRMGGMGGGM